MPNTPIAKRVIKECLQVKEDEQVLIQTWDHTLDISDSLALEVNQAGASPFVNLTTQNYFLNYQTKVHVSHSNGTNLTFAIQDRPVHVRDGIIDQEDISGGNFTESLPSGSVLVAPIETSAEGTVIFDTPQALMGKMLKGFTMKFQNGKLVSFDAKENLDAFAGMYRGASGDKDRLGSFSIGINPKAQIIGLGGADDLSLGGVTIGIGYNKDFGGENDTTVGYAQTLSKATVEVDGRPLLQEGKVQV